MKFLLKLIILSSFIFGNFLELYGTGERYHYISSSGVGLGESYFFSGNKDNINNSFVASHWKSNLTHIYISTKFKSNIGGYSDKDFNLSAFSFTFPFLKNKTLSFGLHPYTRSDVTIIEDTGYNYSQETSEFSGYPLHTSSLYHFYGGISNIYSALSFNIYKFISLGLKLNYLFGNQYKTNKITLSTFESSFDDSDNIFVPQDSTFHIQFNKFSGSSLQLDFILDFTNHQFTFTSTLKGPLNITSRTYYNLYNLSDPLERFTLNDYSFLTINSGTDLLVYEPYYENSISENISINDFNDRVSDIGLGYCFKADKSGIILEHRRTNLFTNSSLLNNGIQIFNKNQPSVYSVHMGYYRKLIISQAALVNSMVLRFGGYYKKLDFGKDSGTDLGLTIGTGVSINNNSDLIDIGIKFGRLSHDILNKEEYFNAIISFDIGERWFDKSRNN